MRNLGIFVVLYWLAYLPVFESSSWYGLSFDPDNFLCANFDTFCSTILDDLGCDPASSSRSVVGCPNFPHASNNITHYVGECECSSPYGISAGSSVLRQLVWNRVRHDVGWMMQPWDSGPAYNYDESFDILCDTTLRRLGCPAEERNASTGVSDNFVCACGSLNIDTLVGNTMMQEVNEYNSGT